MTCESCGTLFLGILNAFLFSINVPKQAFIDASQANNPILSYGVNGIVGLGFTKLSSVDSALNNTGKSDGKALLYNLFADNPSEPNFIAFALQRATVSGGDVEGSFTIGKGMRRTCLRMQLTQVP